ncbi:MAG TPA: site-specific integrase, partial [Patescibacteria group bacterium]|nr:site-specific integrase [Patescibacteria group bacterium]
MIVKNGIKLEENRSYLIDAFRVYLADLQLPLGTQSAYVSEIGRFLSGHTSDSIQTEDITNFVEKDLPSSPNPESLIAAFEAFQAYLNVPATSHQSPVTSVLLSRFESFLHESKKSEVTIKNYRSDLKHFFGSFPYQTISEIFTKETIAGYKALLESQGSAILTIGRKMSVLKQFAAWAVKNGYLETNPLEAPKLLTVPFEILRSVIPAKAGIQSIKKLPGSWTRLARMRAAFTGMTNKFGNKFPRISNLYKKYSSHPASSYVHLAILVAFASLLSVFSYQQFFINQSKSLAYPATLTRPNRVLSFQARLTTSGGAPISTATNISFRLFDSSSGGTELWNSGTCSIDPDDDGIFSTLLGSSCGSEITSNVFTENPDVWLEVTVGSETLSPRQRIATVAYALNSETLRGYPPADPATANTIPVMNSSGQIVLGYNSPSIISTLGTFAVKGNALSIVTNSSTNGNITIAPDGTGQVNLIGGTTSSNFFNVSNANLTTGNLITGSVANNNTGFNLLSLQSGSSLTEKFIVDALGNVTETGYLSAPGATISATYSGATPLVVNGTGGQIFSIANGGNITASSLSTNGGVVYTNGAGGSLAETTAGSAGQCLTS